MTPGSDFLSRLPPPWHRRLWPAPGWERSVVLELGAHGELAASLASLPVGYVGIVLVRDATDLFSTKAGMAASSPGGCRPGWLDDRRPVAVFASRNDSSPGRRTCRQGDGPGLPSGRLADARSSASR